MPRQFVYAPGLPGYGTRGVDGSAGLTGIATYFSAYDGNSDSVTIKSKIIANKELFSNDKLIPGYPTRTYQSGDIFIDKNARIFQIDFDEANLYKDTGIFLNTSGFFSSGPIQSSSPEFERYSNSYETQKYLIDIVYSDTVGDYTTYPVSIYDNAPLYYAQVKYIDQLLGPNFTNVYPFQVWTIGDAIADNAIALVREKDANLWRFGNYDDGSVRDASLSLDFAEIYLQGPTHIDGNIYIDGSVIGGIDFSNIECITLNSSADVSVGGTLYLNDGPLTLTASGQDILFTGSGTHEIYTPNAVLPADIHIFAGNSITTGSPNIGGELFIYSGDGADTVSVLDGGGGGPINFSTGEGGDGTIFSGSNDTNGGIGGYFKILVGNGGDGEGIDGDISGGDGGYFSLKSGDGGQGVATTGIGYGGNGGDVSIMAGAGGYAEGGDENEGGNGGDLFLFAGDNGLGDDDQDGDGGNVYISGGRRGVLSGGGSPGNVEINGGIPNGPIYLNNNSSGSIYISDAGIRFNSESGLRIYKGASDRISISTTTYGEAFRFDGSTFLAEGNIVAFASAFSDIRLKKNIQNLEDPLDFILKLRGVSYNTKKEGAKHYGYIAQELEEIDPTFIVEYSKIGESDDIKYKSIKYSEIIPYLSEAIKEQQKIIEDQNKKIEYLMSEFEKLKNKI